MHVTRMSMRLLFLSLTVLPACTLENTVTGKHDGDDPFDSGVDSCPPDVPCGVDSEETGDSDSPTDSEPEDCSVTLDAGGVVPVDEACSGTSAIPPKDPWNVAMQWHWNGLKADASIHNVIVTPVIGNLDDDNADGSVDEDDVPDVVFVACASSSFSAGHLVVVDGATGIETWSLGSDFNGVGGPALADVDGDGETDIIAFSASNAVRMYHGDGTKIWESKDRASVGYPQATVADLDEDGDVEIIADDLVLDGATGATVTKLSANGTPYRMAAVGDVDLDGEQEIVLGGSVFSPSGAVEFTVPFSGSYGQWSAILDADGDPEGEIAFVGAGQLGIYDPDGAQIFKVAAGSGQPGPPCVADFDGDGQAEIGWAGSNFFNLYELDGSVVWTATINDSSGLSACSGYDIDADGAYEVLYADQDQMFIFDGSSGVVRWSSPDHASGTYIEYPAVADIDHDGSAEIVYASNDYWWTGWSGVTAVGSATDEWPRSGTTWHVHDFAVTNINADGTVPPEPDPPWQVWNVYRARPAEDDPAASDLVAHIDDICVGDCENGLVHLAVSVSNPGGEDVPAGAPWALYRDDGGVLTALQTGTLPDVPSGTSSVGWQIDIAPTDFGVDGLRFVVDDDGAGNDTLAECDEENNTSTWSDALCP